jgi:TonB-linked SusC/RagA family outer membrane protein
VSRIATKCGTLLLALLLFPAIARAQQRDITGRVTDESGAPIPGASVSVAGTAIGILTDAAGNFRLTVPQGTVTILVRTVGYLAREVELPAGQSSVTIALAADILALDELVVTGQATSVSRRNLANAVATVSARELERVPSETIEKMVQGKIAGASIETNSGAPGGGVQVRMRGVTSINGQAEPLYIVDGIIVSNAAIPSNQNAVTEAAGGSNPSLTQDAVVNRIVDLNPNDIESIEVLKGASAAAIYGSRAANGVVIITTKRGRIGPPRFTLTQRFGVFDLSKKLGSRRFETLDEALATFAAFEGATAQDTAFIVEQYGDGRVYDNEEALAGRNDLSHETVLSISGGGTDTRYFVSGAWKDDEGIIANTGFEKQSLRVNLDQRLGDRVEFSVNSAFTHTMAERGLTNNDNSGTSYYMVLPFTPSFVDLSRRPDGTFPVNPFERSNPLQTAALSRNEEDVWRITAGGDVRIEAINTGVHTLRLLANGGVDYFTQENELFFPPELQFEPLDGQPGTSLLSNSSNLDVTLAASMVHTYNAAAAGFTATTSAGLQYQDRDLNIARIESRNLIAGQPNVDAGTNVVIREQRQRVKDLGLYAQEEVLLLDNRMLLTLGIRADRSSSNGDTEKFFFYPKAALSYRFDDLTGFLDGLKLRAAWGQSGNQPLFGRKFTPLTATNNIEGIPGLISGGIAGDAGIEPERQTEIEGGFDATLFDGYASLEFTVFQKNVDNMLLERALAPSTGFATQIFNGGKLRVRGIEIALAATPIRTDRFTWVSRTTFYHDRSIITELPVPPFLTGGFGTSLGAFRIEKGQSATQIVANAGLDADGNTIVAKVGDANPDFRMGFANDFTWRRFNLYSFVDWSQGNMVINLTRFLADAGQNSADFDTDVRPFTRLNPDLTPGPTIMAGAGLRRLLTRGDYRDSRPYMEDGSYVKLREISLSYDLPESVVGRLFGGRVESARITLSGRNLLTFTDYSGLDPEVSNFGNQPIARNIDVAPFPPSRSFWLSFDVGF